MAARGSWKILVPLCLLGGCTHPQRAFVFEPGITPQSAAALVADTLTAEGLQVAALDAGAGLVTTAWVDTGYRFHEPPAFDENSVDVERSVFRRYRVSVVPAGASGQATIRLEAEAKRCTPDVTIRNQRLLGDCHEVNQFFPGLQSDLDQLGEKLRRSARLHATAP
jgi:hypothetical protein